MGRVGAESGKWAVLFLLLLIALSVTVNILLSSHYQGARPPPSPPHNWAKQLFLNSNNNNSAPLPLLINTSACQIPDLPLHAPGEEEEEEEDVNSQGGKNCSKGRSPWTFLDEGGKIRLNPQLPKARCRYKIITRPDERMGGALRDWIVTLSESRPLPLGEEDFNPKAEFVQVGCTGMGGANAAEYHAIPTIERNPRKREIAAKLAFWKGKEQLPPNILLIGHDSTTRLNFRKMAEETVGLLEGLEAHEMLGYLRVGHNTFPIIVPLLSGYSLKDYKAACLNDSKRDFQDSCPLLWGKLDSLKYLTAMMEDSPQLATFHYGKIGFFHAFSDFNPRPVFLKGEKQGCVGPVASSRFLLNYLGRVIEFAKQKKAPYFAFFLQTGETHLDPEGLKKSDSMYADFLEKLDLKNTVLFVFGDHGMRQGDDVSSPSKQLEGNLPNLWVRLGETVKEQWPEWEENLTRNEERLLSPFNFYWTINKILDSYYSGAGVGGAALKNAREKATGKEIRRKSYSSFFEEQREDASCSDVGVPIEFCPCGERQSLDGKHPLVKRAAEFAVEGINRKLEKLPCEKLVLGKVEGGEFRVKDALLTVTFTMNVEKKGKEERARVGVIAWVKLKEGNPEMLLHSDRVTRIVNEFVRECKNELGAWEELFCHCLKK